MYAQQSNIMNMSVGQNWEDKIDFDFITRYEKKTSEHKWSQRMRIADLNKRYNNSEEFLLLKTPDEHHHQKQRWQPVCTNQTGRDLTYDEMDILAENLKIFYGYEMAVTTYWGNPDASPYIPEELECDLIDEYPVVVSTEPKTRNKQEKLARSLFHKTKKNKKKNEVLRMRKQKNRRLSRLRNERQVIKKVE
jgi:hypothetical protein